MPVGRSFRHRETTGELQNELLCVLYLICKNKLLYLNPLSPIFILILEHGSWKDSKDRESGRATNRSSNNGHTKPRDEVEPDLKQSSNKRRSFRETKIPVDDK